MKSDGFPYLFSIIYCMTILSPLIIYGLFLMGTLNFCDSLNICSDSLIPPLSAVLALAIGLISIFLAKLFPRELCKIEKETMGYIFSTVILSLIFYVFVVFLAFFLLEPSLTVAFLAFFLVAFFSSFIIAKIVAK